MHRFCHAPLLVAVFFSLGGCSQPGAQNSALSPADCKNDNQYACVSVLDAGQGNCVVVSCADGGQIVADCGGDSGKASSIKTYFETLGLYDGQLKAVVVSHPHADHYNLLPQVLTDIKTDHRDRYFIDVVQSANVDSEYRDASFRTWYRKFVKDSTDAPLTHQYLAQGSYDPKGSPHSQLTCKGVSGDDGMYVLAANVGLGIPLEEYRREQDPESPCYDEDYDSPVNSKINDRSIVLKLHRTNFDMILPGDAGNKVERNILGKYSDSAFLQTTGLLLSHHGSCYGVNTVAWVETIKPGVIIASAAQNDGYSHPRCTTTSLYQTKAPIVDAAAHRFGCYQARRKYIDPVPNKEKAVYNTLQSSLTVLRYDEGANSYDLWTCPGNQISSACTRGVPK